MAPSQQEDLNRIADEWVSQLHATTAKVDCKLWLDTKTTSDFSVVFFGAPEVKGRKEVDAVFIPFFGKLSALAHDIQHTDYIPPRIYHQCRAHHTSKGEKSKRITASTDVLAVYFVREESGELRCYRMEVYGDPTELNKMLSTVDVPVDG